MAYELVRGCRKCGGKIDPRTLVKRGICRACWKKRGPNVTPVTPRTKHTAYSFKYKRGFENQQYTHCYDVFKPGGGAQRTIVCRNRLRSLAQPHRWTAHTIDATAHGTNRAHAVDRAWRTSQ